MSLRRKPSLPFKGLSVPRDRPEPPGPTRMDSSCMPKPACTSTAGDSVAKPPMPRNLDRLVGVACCRDCLGVLEDLLEPSIVRSGNLQSKRALALSQV